MENNRLVELDAIRGIAALAVVIFHYFYRYNNIYGHEALSVEWAALGKFGVQLFFMVSGFVIYWTLNRVNKPVDFIVSRFSRLYPTFWFSAILTFTIVFIWGLPGMEVNIHQAIMNIFMFHEYIGGKHIDGVYWTLTIELTFYFWIFTFFVTGILRYTKYLFSPLILISILQSQGFIEISFWLNKLFILEYLSYFLAGICFYKVVNKSANKLTYAILALCLISTLFVFSQKVFLISLAFYVFFFFAISGRLKFLSVKPLIFLGGISYSLYLLHQNIGYVIINKFYGLGIDPIISIITAICVSILLAYFTTRFVEKPSLIAIRSAYRQISGYYEKLLTSKE
jgi:peptidoglycan/LPS O-acetylase OafA/YrhL